MKNLTRSLISACLIAFVAQPVCAQQKPTPKSAVKSPARTKKYSRFEWDIGIMLWSEQTHFSNGGEDIPVVSNATALALGGDWRRGSASFGWVYQAGLMYGNITSQSTSSTIIYQKGRDRVYGIQGAAGIYYRIPRSRAEVSLLGQARMRKVDYTVPPGYSFGKDEMIIAGFGEIDVSIPLSKSITLFQQFSAPLTDKRMDTTWVFGLRL